MNEADFLKSARKFADACEENELHGLVFQHSVLCLRRAWFHLNRIDYSHLDQRMQRGSVLHEVSKPRDKSVEGLLGLSPDRIDWANSVVYEAKGGSGAVKAVSAQTAFYALMLSAATNRIWGAANDLLDQKRTRKVHIDTDIAEQMMMELERILEIKRSSRPPEVVRKQICSSCSYRFICGFS